VIGGTRLRSLVLGCSGAYWDLHRTPRGSGSAAESLGLLEKVSIVTRYCLSMDGSGRRLTEAPDSVFILRIELLGSHNMLAYYSPPTLSTYTGAGTGACVFNHPRLSESGSRG